MMSAVCVKPPRSAAPAMARIIRTLHAPMAAPQSAGLQLARQPTFYEELCLDRGEVKGNSDSKIKTSTGAYCQLSRADETHTGVGGSCRGSASRCRTAYLSRMSLLCPGAVACSPMVHNRDQRTGSNSGGAGLVPWGLRAKSFRPRKCPFLQSLPTRSEGRGCTNPLPLDTVCSESDFAA